MKPRNERFGINYGSPYITSTHSYGSYTTAIAERDADLLKSQGWKIVRIQLPLYSDTQGIANCLDMCRVFKERGFFVSTGIKLGAGFAILNPSNFADRQAVMITHALNCHLLGVDEFAVGNEELLNISTYNQGTLSVALKGAAVALRAALPVGYTMKITYSEVQGYGVNSPTDYWKNNPPSPGVDMDYINWNFYGDSQASFEEYIAYAVKYFGTKANITEFNMPKAFEFLDLTETQHAAAILSRLLYMEKAIGDTFVSYLFTYSWDSDSGHGWYFYNISTGVFRTAWTDVLDFISTTPDSAKPDWYTKN